MVTRHNASELAVIAQEVDAEVIRGPAGTIEYAARGEGHPVLVSHGAAGGFDQALLVTEPLVPSGFRVIGVSRDGYLASPLLPSSTPQSQADKYALLLDALGIEAAVILAVSAGGASAIEFALRHGPRCTALVLVSAIVRAVRPAYLGLLPEQAMNWLLKARAFPFLLRRMPDGLLLRMFGVTIEQRRQMRSDPGADLALRSILEAVRDPMGRRAQGTAADIADARHLPEYPFRELGMPVLVVHGSKDAFAPMQHALDVVAEVPHGEMVEVQDGGHLCIVTHRTFVFQRTVRFLSKTIR